jgi:hypothetical protein
MQKQMWTVTGSEPRTLPLSEERPNAFSCETSFPNLQTPVAIDS